ncbi:YceI family protein [Sneathiella marina]|uniref:YceI family protein n=1 Tax=Sneathiella marina TaxID=2950108 RepID=A0ABY4W2N6_9PROT|nr:YceI family protein [Sneathiella marina]USG61096.1 YceI family protein [Sneathiella marina]
MKYSKISRLAALSLFLVLPSISAFAAETYYTDQGHTEVIFSWNHAGVSIQSGEFTTASGKLVLDPDDVGKSMIDVTIDANSLSTGFGPLDTDLKSKNFLDVESFPQITFKSTKVTKTGENTADVTGDLTIHGVTKPVTLKTTMTHRGDHPVAAVIDYYKGKWVAFAATTEIDHQAFGVGPFSTGPIEISIVTEMKDREN